jgi:hypothetical protein
MIERNPFDKSELGRIRSDVAQTKVVAEKDWLLKMLNE